MNDPHVVALRYRLVLGDNPTLDNPPPVEWQVPVCRFRLAEGILMATPTGHYATTEEARTAIEPFVKAYGLQTMLTFGHGILHFDYEAADVIDRDPPPIRPGNHNIVTGTAHLTLRGFTAHAVAHVTWTRYPEPPGDLAVTPDVETLWHRYEGWTAGRELLTGMAYFCLTFVEKVVFDDREEAASKLAISTNVLKELRHLANVGDNETARKADISERRPHTPEQLAWLEKAVRC